MSYGSGLGFALLPSAVGVTMADIPNLSADGLSPDGHLRGQDSTQCSVRQVQYGKMRSFALVPSGESVEVPRSLNDDHVAKDPTQRSTLQNDVLAIYETYATMYPNPRLSEERQERDRLLKAVSAASQATEMKMNPAGKSGSNKSSKGFFSFLWSSSKPDHSSADEKMPISLSTRVGFETEEGDDDRLVYTDDEDDENSSDDPHRLSLCGTPYSLDETCIPSEAHSFVRFHLLSTGSGYMDEQRPRKPNIARKSWEVAGSTLVAITGLGQLVEFTGGKGDPRDSMVVFTSDREELEGYVQMHDSGVMPLVPCYARAATVGPNLLAISWGLRDGAVIFYRRRVPSEDTRLVPWEAVATVGPSESVRNNVGDDIFAEEEQTEAANLLRVTDIVPLVVDTDGVPAATLAISRLGGFIELVRLPARMWYGPEIQPSHRRRRKGRRRDEHYASTLIDIAVSNPTLVKSLTTSAYHTDVMCMEAFRTSVGAETTWNTEAFPDGPPAEHILAASGMFVGGEVVSFWSISTVFSDKVDNNSEIDFNLHATLSEAINLGKVGPDLTVFANKSIMKLWRKPRSVYLRPGDESLQANEHSPCVTTISLPMPVSAIRFTKSLDTTYAAVMDWNGGVSYMDCGLLERVVSQGLSSEEFELLYRNDDADAVVPLAKLLTDRSRTRYLLASKGASRVSDIRWLSPRLNPLDDNQSLLAVITSGPDSLCVVAIPVSKVIEPPLIVPLPNTSSALSTLRAGEVVLVSSKQFQDKQNVDEISVSVLDKLDTKAIVESLVRGSKYKDAIATAKRLQGADRESVSEMVESCKMKLWKSRNELEYLQMVEDDVYVVREAFEFSKTSKIGLSDDEGLALFRSLHEVALQRAKNPRLKSLILFAGAEKKELVIRKLNERLIKLGTYELICRLFSVQTSFDLFCTDFLDLSVQEIATNLARLGEIDALSIVCYRHRYEIRLCTEVLDALPLSIAPSTYHHLLPVPVDKLSGSRFLGICDEVSLLDWYEMPSYLGERRGVAVVLDDSDQMLVLQQKAPDDADVKSSLKSNDTILKWYASRLTEMQHFSQSLDHIIDFAGFALVAFDGTDDSSVLSDIHETLAYAKALEEMLLSDMWSGAAVSRLATLDRAELESLTVEDFVSAVFESLVNQTTIDYRYKKFFRPLMRDQSMDEQICNYLVDKLQESSAQLDKEGFISSLARCAAFASLSRSSMDVANRILKGETSLVDLLKSTLGHFLLSWKWITFGPDELVSTIGFLWSIYESLPRCLDSDDAGEAHLSQFADETFEKLVVLDIMSRWPKVSAIRVLSETTADRLVECAMTDICGSFCSQLDDQKIISRPSHHFEFVTMLFSDLCELRRLKLAQNVAVDEVVTESLLASLLQSENVDVVGAILAEAPPGLIQQEKAKSAIMTFVDEALFSEDVDASAGGKLRAAVALKEVLKRNFSASELELQTAWSYLDAANFVNDVLLSSVGARRMTPGDVRSQKPLDVLEALLRDHPHLVILNCKEWEDAAWATSANQVEREYTADRSLAVESSVQISRGRPTLPGGAVFHLAHLLGLESPAAATVVKCRVIHHAVSCKLFGAAAAVCRMILRGENSLRDKSSIASVVEAICIVVSTQQYDDCLTKVELCKATIGSFISSVDTRQLRAFQRISDILQQQELLLLGGAGATQPKISRNAFHSIQNLVVDTRSEYASDLTDLFRTFRVHASDLSLDDSLTMTLSRFVAYWCIAQATRPKPHMPSSMETTQARNIISMAASLLLHVGDTGLSGSTLRELQLILRDQADAASKISETDSMPLQPDKQIVSGLVGRGYSQLGARRAVIMTRNRGYDEAMQWAVRHSLEHGFDDPMVFVGRQNPLFLDSDGIRLLKACLGTTNQIVAGEIDIDTVTKSARHENVDSGDKLTIGVQRDDRISAPVVTEGKFQIHEDARVPSPDFFGSYGITDASDPQSEEDKDPRNIKQSSPDHSVSIATKVEPAKPNAQAPSVTLDTKRALPPSAPQQKTILQPSIASKSPRTEPAATPRPTRAPPPGKRTPVAVPPQADPSRSSLLRRGRDALNEARQSRSRSGSPSAEADRRRLIEAGRRLLQRTRSGHATQSNITKCTAPTPPQPLVPSTGTQATDSPQPVATSLKVGKKSGLNLDDDKVFTVEKVAGDAHCSGSDDNNANEDSGKGWDFDEDF